MRLVNEAHFIVCDIIYIIDSITLLGVTINIKISIIIYNEYNYLLYHIINNDNSYNIVITYIYHVHYVIINKVCYINVICHILHNYVIYLI